jgi:hypothetical protein
VRNAQKIASGSGPSGTTAASPVDRRQGPKKEQGESRKRPFVLLTEKNVQFVHKETQLASSLARYPRAARNA